MLSARLFWRDFRDCSSRSCDEIGKDFLFLSPDPLLMFDKTDYESSTIFTSAVYLLLGKVCFVPRLFSTERADRSALMFEDDWLPALSFGSGGVSMLALIGWPIEFWLLINTLYYSLLICFAASSICSFSLLNQIQ